MFPFRGNGLQVPRGEEHASLPDVLSGDELGRKGDKSNLTDAAEADAWALRTQ